MYVVGLKLFCERVESCKTRIRSRDEEGATLSMMLVEIGASSLPTRADYVV